MVTSIYLKLHTQLYAMTLAFLGYVHTSSSVTPLATTGSVLHLHQPLTSSLGVSFRSTFKCMTIHILAARSSCCSPRFQHTILWGRAGLTTVPLDILKDFSPEGLSRASLFQVRECQVGGQSFFLEYINILVFFLTKTFLILFSVT